MIRTATVSGGKVDIPPNKAIRGESNIDINEHVMFENHMNRDDPE